MRHVSFLLAVMSAMLVSVPCMSQAIHSVNWRSGVNIKVVKDWSNTLDSVSSVNSTTYINKKVGGKDKLHKKGHRDVIVWIPETTDLRRDYTVVLWFHGHYGYVPHRTFRDRTLKQFVPLSKDKNFVVVIPEMPWSVHTKTPIKRNSRLWMKPGDFLEFVWQVQVTIIQHYLKTVDTQSLLAKPMGRVDFKIVGHSAGGSTIKRLGITGDLCKLKPSLVVWSDSSYGSWVDDAWNGCLKDHPGILVKIFVHKGGSPWRSATRFFDQFSIPPENFKLYIKSKGWSHKLIGNNIVKLSGLLD